MLQLMRDWGTAKGKAEKEINRKIESNLYGT